MKVLLLIRKAQNIYSNTSFYCKGKRNHTPPVWPIALASAEHSTETINFLQLREPEIQSAELKDNFQKITQIKVEHNRVIGESWRRILTPNFRQPYNQQPHLEKALKRNLPTNPPLGSEKLLNALFSAIIHSTSLPGGGPQLRRISWYPTLGNFYTRRNNHNLNIGHTNMTWNSQPQLSFMGHLILK